MGLALALQAVPPSLPSSPGLWRFSPPPCPVRPRCSLLPLGQVVGPADFLRFLSAVSFWVCVGQLWGSLKVLMSFFRSLWKDPKVLPSWAGSLHSWACREVGIFLRSRWQGRCPRKIHLRTALNGGKWPPTSWSCPRHWGNRGLSLAFSQHAYVGGGPLTYFSMKWKDRV